MKFLKKIYICIGKILYNIFLGTFFVFFILMTFLLPIITMFVLSLVLAFVLVKESGEIIHDWKIYLQQKFIKKTSFFK